MSMSSVVNRNEESLISALEKYAVSAKISLKKLESPREFFDVCTVNSADGNTTILYSGYYTEFDKISAFLSKELTTPVFTFHIHDGDLWMYVLYENGQVIDSFNPIPDYWDTEISNQEIARYAGNADIVASIFPEIKEEDIEKYLVRWDLNSLMHPQPKAYEGDIYAIGDEMQLLDFMRKLKLPFPLSEKDWSPLGQQYSLE